MAVKQRQMCNWFWRMVEGMPLREFFRVLACGQTMPDVMFFDHVGRQVKHFAPMILPWPIEYLLAHHNPKHVLGGSRMPSLGSIGKAIYTWEQKLRWPLVLGDSRQSRWSFLHAKKPYVHPCDAPMPSAVEEFFSEVKTSFYREVMKIRHRSSRFHSKFSNVFGIIRFAFECLRQGPYLALKTDKDGGFCLVLKEALKHETELVLNTGSRYSEVFFGHGFERTLLLEFAEAAFSAAEVAPLEDDDKKDFVSSLLQPARVSKAANVFACLKYTVKTHKPPGEVGFRALHSSVNTPVLGAMKFIASLLKPQLTALPHLLKRSADVVKQLQHCRVSPSAYLITIDIKDFFMDGNHAQITSACQELVEPSWRSSFLILVKFILDTQYLTSPCFPERMWKVNKGAGMGLQCSGELVDSTFFKTVEEGILPQLDRWRIVGYFRFKDDILVISDSPREVLLDFVSTLKKASSVWKLKVESVSQTEARFLDLRLFKGARWLATGCLDISINHRVTAQKQPVATHSMHPPHTHLSWPRPLVHRINTLCNSRMYQLEELSRLKCMIAERCGWEHVSLVFDHVRRRAPISNHSDVKVVASRLMIPYHKEWEIGAIHSTLQRVLHRYQRTLHLQCNVHVTMSISYTLQTRHLDTQLWNLWMADHGWRMGTAVD